MTTEADYYDLRRFVNEAEFRLHGNPDPRVYIILSHDTYQAVMKQVNEAREEIARFEAENTQINYIGRRLAVVDEHPGFKVTRLAVIKKLFHDKHFIVEFEDDHLEREIYVDEIRVGSDVIK